MTQEEFNKMLIKAIESRAIKFDFNLNCKEEHGFITGLTAGIEVLDNNNDRLVGIYDRIML